MASPSAPARRPSTHPHFLLLPLPEQGHIIPMLSFASRLAALSCTVTFVRVEKAPLALPPQPQIALPDQLQAQKLADVPPFLQVDLPEKTLSGLHAPARAVVPSNTEVSCLNGMHASNASPFICTEASLVNGNHTAAPATDPAIAKGSQLAATLVNGMSHCGTNVQFWALPYSGGPSSLTAASSRFDILKQTLADLEDRKGLVEKLVQDSKSTDAPIACIICDAVLWSWVNDLGKRHAIPAAILVPCAGVSFYMPYLMKIGKIDESMKLCRHMGLPETKPTSPNEIKKMEEIRSVFMKMYDGVEEASHVLVNSFGQLESALVESLSASELNIKFIGPCLPAWNAGNVGSELENAMAKEAGCLFSPDHTCLPWLDGQEKGSVLFVSFGSEVSLEEGQVQELAIGIERSGYKFLWVLRPDMPSHNLPQEDFRKRTRDMGMFVSWAPQRLVLQHSAVGGFLSHCGWNSTLESMMSGVPMLCFPLDVDQFLNAQFIVAHWKAGLHMGPPRTLVQRAEVERAVRDLMGSDDIRRHVVRLKEAAHCALSDAQMCAESFVQDIAEKHSCSHTSLR